MCVMNAWMDSVLVTTCTYAMFDSVCSCSCTWATYTGYTSRPNAIDIRLGRPVAMSLLPYRRALALLGHVPGALNMLQSAPESRLWEWNAALYTVCYTCTAYDMQVVGYVWYSSRCMGCIPLVKSFTCTGACKNGTKHWFAMAASGLLMWNAAA